MQRQRSRLFHAFHDENRAHVIEVDSVDQTFVELIVGLDRRDNYPQHVVDFAASPICLDNLRKLFYCDLELSEPFRTVIVGADLY